jgi:hypothetical protein
MNKQIQTHQPQLRPRNQQRHRHLPQRIPQKQAAVHQRADPVALPYRLFMLVLLQLLQQARNWMDRKLEQQEQAGLDHPQELEQGQQQKEGHRSRKIIFRVIRCRSSIGWTRRSMMSLRCSVSSSLRLGEAGRRLLHLVSLVA